MVPGQTPGRSGGNAQDTGTGHDHRDFARLRQWSRTVGRAVRAVEPGASLGRRTGWPRPRVAGPDRRPGPHRQPEVCPGRRRGDPAARVRASMPTRTRNGSQTSSTVVGSSPTATASVVRPDRTAAERAAQRAEHRTVQPVQAQLVDVVDGQRGPGDLPGDRRRRRGPGRSRAPGAAAGWRSAGCRGTDRRSRSAPSGRRSMPRMVALRVITVVSSAASRTPCAR